MNHGENTRDDDDVYAVAAADRSHSLQTLRFANKSVHHPLLICEVVTSSSCKSGYVGQAESSGSPDSKRSRDDTGRSTAEQRADIAAPLRLLLNTHTNVDSARSSARGFACGSAWNVPGGRCEIARALMDAGRQASQPLTRNVHRAVTAELCTSHPELLDEIMRHAEPVEQWTDESTDAIRTCIRLAPKRRAFGIIRAATQGGIEGKHVNIAVMAAEEAGRRASESSWPEARELLRDIERLTVCGAGGPDRLTRGHRMRVMNALEKLSSATNKPAPRGSGAGPKSRRRR